MTHDQTIKLVKGNYQVEMTFLGEEQEQGNLHACFSMKRKITFGGKELEAWSLIGSMPTNLSRTSSKDAIEKRAEQLLSVLASGPTPNAVGSGNGQLVLPAESVKKLQAIACANE
jgi:hypothetical protein